MSRLSSRFDGSRGRGALDSCSIFFASPLILGHLARQPFTPVLEALTSLERFRTRVLANEAVKLKFLTDLREVDETGLILGDFCRASEKKEKRTSEKICLT